MPNITIDGKRIHADPEQSVLDALLNAGETIPHSCKSGACQSCMLRALKGSPPEGSQAGLKATHAQTNHFLSCIAHVHEDLTVALPGEGIEINATIRDVQQLSPTVYRVLIQPEAPFPLRAGQFITLRHGDLARSYSIASPSPTDPHTNIDPFELHVRRIDKGRMTTWLCNPNAIGEPVTLRGPAGDCFYTSDTNEPLALIGTGTGLAPLLGVIRDALRTHHAAPITLIHGAYTHEGFYLTDHLRELEATAPNLTVIQCARTGDPSSADVVGELDAIALERINALADHRFYLCGDPALVHKLRKKLFINGARMSHIHADAFELAPPPTPAHSPP